MKKINQLFVLVVLLLSIHTVFAQDKVFDNGKLVYKMDMKRNDPTYGNMTINTDLNITLLGKEMKTETKMTVMGMSVNVTYIINKKTKSGVILLESPQGNMAAKIAPENYEAFMAKQSSLVDTGDDVKLTNETLTVLKYTTKKAILTSKDGVEADVYYTDELGVIPDADGTGLGIKGIKGIPLKVQVSGTDGEMNLEVVSIEKGNVDASLFVYDIPEGYQEVDYSLFAAGN